MWSGFNTILCRICRCRHDFCVSGGNYFDLLFKIVSGLSIFNALVSIIVVIQISAYAMLLS